MDGSEGVLVVGASSDKDDLDPALLRSGRMDKHICLYAPDKAGRTAILQHYIDELDPVPTGINCAAIAEQIPGLNGADIKTMVNEAVAESIFAGTPLTSPTKRCSNRRTRSCIATSTAKVPTAICCLSQRICSGTSSSRAS